MAFFRGLQDSTFTEWFLGSASIWTYPTVLTLHTDRNGDPGGREFRRQSYACSRSPARFPCNAWRPSIGSSGPASSSTCSADVVLFVTQAADRVQDPVFYVKLGSIALALWFGVLVKRASIDAADAPQVTPPRSRRLAAAGLGLWTIAIVAGRLMAYLHP